MSSKFKESKSLVQRTRSFFGVESGYSNDEVEAWNQRRLKFCVNKFGNLNYEKLRLNDVSQSINATDADSIGETTDNLDSSYQVSSAAPYNFSAPRRHLSTKSFLNSSVISPQTSIQTFGDPLRKQHAFKAIANVVSGSLRLQNSAAHKDIPRSMIRHRPSIDEPINMEFASLKMESRPTEFHEKVYCSALNSSNSERKSRSTINRISLKWSESMIEKVRDSRRRFTDSLVGRLICCLPKQSRDTKMLANQIDDLPQYRPYFTYWVSLVQVIVFIASISVYGLAPIDLNFIRFDSDKVLVPSASVEQVCRLEYSNMFVGLRQADLIRLGARYSPCMRKDENLQRMIIDDQRDRDRLSGCCIRNDGGGCFQTIEEACSRTLAIWNQKKNHEEGQVLNSVVCGLDPEFCEHPKSMAPFQWSDDVVKWPICQKQSVMLSNVSSITGNHMQCEVTGRPCCIGSKAECIVTTRQHCFFLRGYYHPEASICSQVNCLNEICGMLNFYDPNRPDQFYRLLTAIFLNYSLGSIAVTLCVQMTIMRDLEKMAGWHRISIIYILSGIVGNLCSGIFLPYQVQTGASGSIFALLAMTFTEFLQSWKIIKKPWPVFFKFLGLGLFLFILGFLPFFDNFAQMTGLFSGIILSFILLPFLGMPSIRALQKLMTTSISPKEAFEIYQQKIKRRRLLIIIGCSLLWILLTGMCFVFFYWLPVTQCSFCKYFNCIPVAPYFCDNMDVNITTKTACVIKK